MEEIRHRKNGAAPFTLWDQEEGAKYEVQVRCKSDLTTTKSSQLCQSVDFFDVINLGWLGNWWHNWKYEEKPKSRDILLDEGEDEW